MNYFYYPQINSFELNTIYPLSNKDIVQHLKARRFTKKDAEFFDGFGNIANVELEKENKKWSFLITSKVHHKRMHPRFKIYLPVLESKRQSFLISKLTELGVDLFIFYNSDYTQKRPLSLDRWKQISISACEQSGRLFIPNFFSLNSHLKKNENPLSFQNCILHWEKAKDPPLIVALPGRIPLQRDKKLLAKLARDKTKGLNILIGPEGGFSGEETEQLVDLENKKYSICHSFHPSILRVETAAIALVSILKYQLYSE